jgi:hypothetical protein
MTSQPVDSVPEALRTMSPAAYRWPAAVGDAVVTGVSGDAAGLSEQPAIIAPITRRIPRVMRILGE